MATCSSIHAWKIPWTEEPVGLQSNGSQRVGYDWATSLHLEWSSLGPSTSLQMALFHSLYGWVIFHYHNKLWEILKEMGIPKHLTCLLRNLYACQEATVRTRHETMSWTGSKLGKGYVKAPVSSCLCNLYAEYIMWNAGLDEAQARIKIAGRNINNLR